MHSDCFNVYLPSIFNLMSDAFAGFVSCLLVIALFLLLFLFSHSILDCFDGLIEMLVVFFSSVLSSLNLKIIIDIHFFNFIEKKKDTV